jgi:hypothetical protein
LGAPASIGVVKTAGVTAAGEPGHRLTFGVLYVRIPSLFLALPFFNENDAMQITDASKDANAAAQALLARLDARHKAVLDDLEALAERVESVIDDTVRGLKPTRSKATGSEGVGVPKEPVLRA